jgi:hypothetical protein
VADSKKHEYQLILAHLKSLEKKYAKEARSWWPRFIFHYTHLENAASILNTGMLYSRNEALRKGLMGNDNASQSVITHTEDKWKDYVRLYFRPRTPTQYRNEGIRPENSRAWNAHCPIPIFLLFDAADLLTRKETGFSSRSLARSHGSAEYSSRAFTKLPFDKIYHNTWLADEEKEDIKACRHAEIIVPGALDLKPLKFIWCRSQAEKTTLLSLLKPAVKTQWADKIFEGKKYDLFEARWTFIERADLSSEEMTFFFNPNTATPGPFKLKVIVDLPESKGLTAYENGQFSANSKLALKFKTKRDNYTVHKT